MMALPTGLTPAMLDALLNGPALAPPNGTIPNFTNPPGFQVAQLAVQVISLVLSTLAVFIRVYTRHRINKKIQLEDYLCLLAWGLFIGIYVVALMINPIASRHQWDLQMKNLKPFLFNLHIGQILSAWVVMALKASILLQYNRIFSSTHRGVFFWSCHALIWINFVFYAACFFVEIFSCRPIAKAWDPLIVSGSCINVFTVNIVAASVNAASDFLIFLLPQPLIWSLHMRLRKKIGISLLLASALLACTCATIRTYYCIRLARSHDLVWESSMMGLYIFPEFGLGIVVSCLPPVAKFCKTIVYLSSSRFGNTISSLFDYTRFRSTSRDSLQGTASPLTVTKKPRQENCDDPAYLEEGPQSVHKEISDSTSNEDMQFHEWSCQDGVSMQIFREIEVSTQYQSGLQPPLTQLLELDPWNRQGRGENSYKTTIFTQGNS